MLDARGESDPKDAFEGSLQKRTRPVRGVMDSSLDQRNAGVNTVHRDAVVLSQGKGAAPHIFDEERALYRPMTGRVLGHAGAASRGRPPVAAARDVGRTLAERVAQQTRVLASGERQHDRDHN